VRSTARSRRARSRRLALASCPGVLDFVVEGAARRALEPVRWADCMAVLGSLLALASAAGCGGGGSASVVYASPQEIRISSNELDGYRGHGFRLQIRSLRLTSDRWLVTATVTNATRVNWVVRRPHVRGGTKFGLFVLSTSDPKRWRAEFEAGRTTPSLLAERFQPSLPARFAPGERWSGVFSGRGRIPQGSFVRFAFGRFTTSERPPTGLAAGLMAVTRHSVRVG